MCAGAGLTPSSLDLPVFCGGGCADLAVGSLPTFADCLICRADEAVEALLDDALGTAPPDLPPNVVSDPPAQVCQKQLVKAAQKGVAGTQKTLAPCEVSNITSVSPLDCAATEASALATVSAKVNTADDKCESTTGMLGCLFDPVPDPACLGTAAETIGSALVEQVFETRD